MMEAVRTSEMSVDNHFTWQYIPEDNSEHHTRRRENLKSHIEQSLLVIRQFFIVHDICTYISREAGEGCLLHICSHGDVHVKLCVLAIF
jgi:hypothetical protein